MELFQFTLTVTRHRGVADVCIDLALGCDANAHRFQPTGEVDFVCRNDHPTGRNFVTDQFGF